MTMATPGNMPVKPEEMAPTAQNGGAPPPSQVGSLGGASGNVGNLSNPGALNQAGGLGGPGYGTAWQPPPGSGGVSPPSWQPQQQQQPNPYGAPMPPPPPPQQQRYAPPQSIAQQGLGGNASQTQAFLAALKGAGAGSNNQFMSSGAPQQQQPAQLLGQLAAPGGGSAGSAQYTSGFNGGMGNVSYNQGLGAFGGAPISMGLSPTTSTSGLIAQPGGASGYGGSLGPPAGMAPPPNTQSGYGAGAGQQFGSPASGANGLGGYAWTSPSASHTMPNGGTQPYAGTGVSAGAAGPGYVPQQGPLAGGQMPPLPGQMMQGPTSALAPYAGSGVSAGPGGPGYMPGLGTGATGSASPQATRAVMPPVTVSDERAKEAIAPGKRSLDSFLSTIRAHSYEYKDPAHGVGRFVSPMAQELEATELGKSSVETGPDGLKRVNYGRLVGVSLAAQSELHREQKKLAKRLAALEATRRGSGGRR